MFKKILFIASIVAVFAFAYCNYITAYKTGEYVDSERNVKVCVYNGYGKTYYSSVGTYNLCPLQIQVCQQW